MDENESMDRETIETTFKQAGFKVKIEKDKKIKKEEKTMSKPKSLLKQKVAELKKKLEGVEGLSKENTQAKIDALKEVAPDYAALLPEARATLRQLNEELGGEQGQERWRKNPELRADGEAAQEVVDFCRENPFVADILAKQHRDAVAELREKATTNLHKALGGETGEVAVRVEYLDKFTKQPRTRWLRVEVNAKGHAGQYHIVESEVPFLTGTNREGKEIWDKLGTPPDFKEVRSFELRKAFVSLYEFEEKRASQEARIKEILENRTMSVTEATEGKVGYFAAHHRDWNTPKGGGPVTYGGDATDEYLILREFFAPAGQLDLTDLIGKEQVRGKLDPRFGKLVRYRLEYETRQAEKDAAGRNEPANKEE